MDYAAPLPTRYRDVLDWFEPTPAQQPVEEWVIDAVDAGIPARGFSLLGPPGTGKTTTACWAALSVDPMSLGYVTSLKYQHALQERISVEKMSGAVFKGEDEDTLLTTLARYENVVGWTRWLRTRCDLLVFDDWGKEHTTHTGFIEDEIEFLLRERYDLGLPTILTTNMGLTSIQKRFGDSMASFIHEAFPPIVLDGADRRKP